MIQIEKEQWEDIPILIVTKHASRQQALPVITYLHGFTSAKEDNLAIAYLLAEKGYRVLLPDAFLHGERTKGVDPVEQQLRFLDIVQQNVSDLETIKSMLESRNWLVDDRFGLAGTSMGGISTAAALTNYPWIKVAAVLMGSPKLSEFAQGIISVAKEQGYLSSMTDDEIKEILLGLKQFDLSLHPDRLKGRPLFMWHGEEDAVVPFTHAFSFYEKIRADYQNPAHIRFLSEKKTGHKVSRFARLEAANWFAEQL